MTKSRCSTRPASSRPLRKGTTNGWGASLIQAMRFGLLCCACATSVTPIAPDEASRTRRPTVRHFVRLEQPLIQSPRRLLNRQIRRCSATQHFVCKTSHKPIYQESPWPIAEQAALLCALRPLKDRRQPRATKPLDDYVTGCIQERRGKNI